MATKKNLVERIRLFEREERVKKKIDWVRDHISEPVAMRKEIAKLLVAEFSNCIGCIIGIGDPKNSSVITNIVFSGRDLRYPGERKMRDVLESVALFDGPAVVTGHLAVNNFPQYNYMAIHIMLDEEMLGTMVLIGEGPEFDGSDVEVFEEAELHIDSAIIQGRRYYLLEQKEKVIAAFEGIDRVRDQQTSLSKMLRGVARKAKTLLPCEEIAILLYNARDDSTTISITTKDLVLKKNPEKGILIHTAEAALEDGKPKKWSGKGSKVRSTLCLPLMMKGRKLGVIVAVNRIGASAFTSEDEEILRAIGAQTDTAIFENLASEKVRIIFGQLVDEKVMRKLLENPDELVKFKHSIKPITALFTDLRESSKTAEKEGMSSEMFSQFVNECFEATSHAIQSEEGLLNKFTGDGVMALFNVPLAQKYYALCAVKSALKIRDAHAKVMNKWHKHGLALRLGIGLCSGNALVGLYGSKNRFEYTAMGTTVNRAARIQEKAAREPDQEILICENTYKLVAKFVKVGNKMAIEGKKDEKPIIVYPLISLR